MKTSASSLIPPVSRMKASALSSSFEYLLGYRSPQKCSSVV